MIDIEMGGLMQHVIGVTVCLAVFVFVLWLFGGSKQDEILDPSNDRQIGILTGLLGGSIADAAVVRYALQRFEETHGRKATTRDAATVAAMMKTMN